MGRPNCACLEINSSKNKRAFGLPKQAFENSSITVLDELESIPRFLAKLLIPNWLRALLAVGEEQADYIAETLKEFFGVNC